MGAALRLEGVERIIVLRANALGDFIFALPALEALRAAYPGAHLTLLGRGWHGPFLAGRGSPVEEVIPVPGDSLPEAGAGGRWTDAPWMAAPPADVDAFLEDLRARRFDIALQLHGGGRNSNALVAGIGARLSAGLRTPDAMPLHRSVPYVYHQQEAARCLEVVALVGAEPVTLAPRLNATPRDREAAAAVLEPGSRYAVLHPGASDPRRRWPAERFAAVGDELVSCGLEVVLTGTADEGAVTAAVASGMRSGARDLAGRTSLSALVGILAAARLAVSNDSGPMHLAVALGTPTVGIYWVGNLINGGPLTRSLHRPVLSWRTRCPTCGVDCILERCEHRASFTDEAPLAEVVAAVSALLETDALPATLAHALHPGPLAAPWAQGDRH